MCSVVVMGHQDGARRFLNDLLLFLSARMMSPLIRMHLMLRIEACFERGKDASYRRTVSEIL